MHEHSLADAIVEAVETKRRQAGASRVIRALVRVSEISSLSSDALQLMIDHAAEEMGVQPFRVELVRDGLLGHCPNCGLAPVDEELTCCLCGARPVRPAGDEAMLLVSCELE